MNDDYVAIQYRLAQEIIASEVITADGVTMAGRFAVDHEHRPNARQSTIGAVFRWAAGLGLLEPTSSPPLRSRSPRRRMGTVRQWRRTDAGIAWAITFIDTTPDDLLATAAIAERQLALWEGAD